MQVEELRQFTRVEQNQGRLGTDSLIPQDSGTCLVPKDSQATRPSIPAGLEF